MERSVAPSTLALLGIGPLAMSSPSPAAAAASERQAAPDVGEGWTTEEVTRKGGKTAGSKDKYWYSPSGKKFRSKAEIGRYKEALAKEEGDEDAAWKLVKGAKKSTPSSSAKGKAKAKSAASAGATSSRSSSKKKAASTSPKKKKAASASPKKKAAADSSDDDFEKPKAKGKKSNKNTASGAKVQVGLAQAFAASSKKKRPAAESDAGGEEKKEDEDGVSVNTGDGSGPVTDAKGVPITAVGYSFEKNFKGYGWFKGKVVEILPGAAGGKDRRCEYEDGDMEDLSLHQLRSLQKAATKVRILCDLIFVCAIAA